MGNKNQEGGFFKGLIREPVAYYRGFESEITEERMRFRVRKIGLGIQGYTNVAQNVGFRTGKIRTSFGFASMGYPRGDGGKQRCFGIIPSPIDKTHFYASFCSNTPTSELSYFDLLAQTITPLDNSIPQTLASYGILNQKVYIANGSSFNYCSGSAIFGSVTQIPDSPTAPNTSTTLFTIEGKNSGSGVDRVQKFGPTGTFIQTWGSTGTGAAQFENAAAICSDISGTIYVLDQVNLRILKFDSQGDYTQFTTITLPSSIGTYTTSSGYNLGMAVDHVGNIWIVSQAVNALFQFSPAGTLINQFGSSGSGNGQFNTPTNVCVDANGNIWVTDTNNSRVQQFTNYGVFMNAVSVGVKPWGICADNNQSVYITSTSGTTIFAINITSLAQTSFSTTSSRQFNSTITTDNVYLYVQDAGTGSASEISIYTLGGVFQSSFGSAGASTGEFEYLNGQVAVVTNAFAPPPNGYLNGAYLYVATFSDANGNSTGAGAPLQVTLAYQQANINVDSVGFDISSKGGWQFVNLYRTVGLLSSIPPLSQAPISQVYYLVGSKPLTGAGTYNFVDNISDLGSQDGITTKNILTTNTPVIISTANYVIEFENRIYAIGVTDNTDSQGNIVNARNYHPARVRWCELNNPGSWPPLNFTDINEGGQNLPLTGAWAADRMIYLFKESFTFEMVPTGQNDPTSNGVLINGVSPGGVPYNYVQVSHEYGFFHHTIADMGGTIIGKCRDCIASFTGTKFAPVSYGISSLLERLINPTGDSGAFDNNNKKYYLAVCDSSLPGTYGPPMQSGGVNYLLQNAWRNTTLVFDTAENTWEVHPYTFNQVYRAISDNYGKQVMLYGGVCSEIGILTGENQFGGPSYPGIGTLQAGNIIQDTTFGAGNNAAGFIGKTICIPFHWDSTTSTLNYLNFISTITAAQNVAGTLVLTLADVMPAVWGTNKVYIVDNATGLSDTGSSGSFQQDEDGNFLRDANGLFLPVSPTGKLYGGVTNEFNANGINGCSWVYNSNTLFTGYPIFDQLNDQLNGLAVSQTNIINSSGISGLGLQYVFLPYRFFQTPPFNELQPWEPRRLYLSSPYGLDEENIVKSFRYLELIVRGMAKLLIRIYINGSQTYIQKKVQPLSTGQIANSALQTIPLTKYIIDLGGYTGTFIRVELGSIKGNDMWEVQACAVWFRQQGSLRNNAT